MKRPGSWGAGPSGNSLAGDAPDDTAAPKFPQLPQRLEPTGRTIALGLLNLRFAGEPGHEDADSWAEGLATILRARLESIERLGLATAAVWSLDAEQAEALAEHTLGDLRQGAPVPPFLNPRDEARDWAAWASPAEHKAYLAACFHRLPDKDRSGFLKAARKVAA